MDRMILKKFNIEIKILTAILITSVLLLIGTLVVVAANLKMTNEIGDKEKRLSAYVESCGVNAEQEMGLKQLLVSGLENEHRKLKEIFEGVKSRENLAVNPLYFKQRLFDVQDKLREMAKKQKVSLPPSLGFEDYELKLPDVSQVSVLMQELVMVEEVLTRLMGDGISSVKKIELPHERMLVEYKGEDGDVVSLDSFYMLLDIEIGYDALKKLLGYLSGYDNPYVISLLNITKKNSKSEELSAKLGIRTLKL